MKRPLISTLAVVIVACIGQTFAAELPDETDMRLLRMPDIHGDQVVFSYGGNLWTVSAQGGEARRLTSHIGYESEPKFSPDGEWIAFSGEYDGNADVYIVPAVGGEPTRLTYHPGRDRVIDWQPDGNAVRFQSSRTSETGSDRQLWTVATAGGLPARLVLPSGGLSSYSPDGKRLAYNRMTREHRTWKRYKGGMAQDVWIYDFDANLTERVTTWIGSDNFPMWHENTIYYSSDQTDRLEIWAYDVDAAEHRQVTEHREYDVKYPSLGPDAIVYENGGWLYVMDLATERTRKLTVSLHDDRVHTRPAIKSVANLIDDGDISPDGKRVVMAARGDVFTLPAEKGNVRNLTATPGVRERVVCWSPDGKWIAYFSDATGEYEIYLHPYDDKGDVRQLTRGIDYYPQGMQWSPDSEKLAFHDAALNLYWVDLENGRPQQVDQSSNGEIGSYDWSPDSVWLAYAKTEANGFRSVFLYNTADETISRVTTDLTTEGRVAFDPEGKFLYFTSARHFNPTIDGYDMKPLWTEMNGIYLVTLTADEPYPFPPESDEVEVADEDEDAEDDEDEADDDEDGEDTADEDGDAEGEGDDDEEEEVEPTEIDLENIGDRIVALDVEAGNYSSLIAAEGKLFYLSTPTDPGSFGGDTSLKLFDMEERKVETVLASCDGYGLSADQQKVFYVSDGSYGIVDAGPDQSPSEKPLRTAEMRARIEYRAEWSQMFRDAWRQQRDFFYDPDLHGVDWDRMFDRYSQLVPYVAHRTDLDYIIGELIGELNCSHAYVRREQSDVPGPERVQVGLLGCDLALDDDGDGFVLARIFTEKDWNRDQVTPLSRPGLEVAENEYLLAVDGIPLTPDLNPYSLFEGSVGRQVVLEVGSNADGSDSREIIVEPIASESGLRYEAWVQGNRRKVHELSDGKIGYLHLPNTAVGGMQNFAKGYYPQLRREGLIIDERFNGGGWVPIHFMNIMRQRLVNMWHARYGENNRTPGTTFLGQLAMLSNSYAGSGGDALPYYFKQYELGPIIGTRTWGGLVGYRRAIGLMDGGGLTMPEFGIYNLQGDFVVENYGVDPTIPVDNLPHEVINGRDPQLEKAVEVLLESIAQESAEEPEHGQFPKDRD
ncbi:MAG: S41 family peptidase [bacterium]